MKVLELFSGTASFSRVARKRGHDTFTVDIDGRCNPDLIADIRTLQAREIVQKFGSPDVIAASPECTRFSRAAQWKNWFRVGDRHLPTNPETCNAVSLVRSTLRLIEELSPVCWYIENPVGMLRHVDFMAALPNRVTVTYCQYAQPHEIGEVPRKATDFWVNDALASAWLPRPVCVRGSLCHLASGWGPRQGTARRRGVIPKDLCIELLTACEMVIQDDPRKTAEFPLCNSAKSGVN